MDCRVKPGNDAEEENGRGEIRGRFGFSVIPEIAKRLSGIHNHDREYGFRARAKDARPGMTASYIFLYASTIA